MVNRASVFESLIGNPLQLPSHILQEHRPAGSYRYLFSRFDNEAHLRCSSIGCMRLRNAGITGRRRWQRSQSCTSPRKDCNRTTLKLYSFESRCRHYKSCPTPASPASLGSPGVAPTTSGNAHVNPTDANRQVMHD